MPKVKNKRIDVHCNTGFELGLSELTELQGDLKTLTKERAEKLKNSLKEKGFWFPFFVWKNGGRNYFIDGHLNNTK